MLAPFRAVAPRHFATAPVEDESVDRILTADDFARARAEITCWEGYMPTPLVSLDALACRLGLDGIYYKDEGPRFGLGSFKALGGAYAAERQLARKIGMMRGEKVSLADVRNRRFAEEASAITLVSATDGNHGRSLAWGAQRFGARCVIYIHAEVSEGRAQAMRDLGAKVVRIVGDYDDSVRLARENAEANGWFVISDTSWEGYSDPSRDVMAGYGVMIDEAVAQCTAPPTHVFVQGGVGGLAAAVFARLNQVMASDRPRAVVVEPELAACLFESAREGRATAVELSDETLMAGLSCGEPSPLAWPVIAAEAGDFLTIPESYVAPAMRLLARPLDGDTAVAAGESGVAGLAALIGSSLDPGLAQKLGLGSGSRVLLFGTEGVTDPEIYRSLVGG